MSDMQETQKSRVRFSVIDFIILLLVIACIVGIVMRYDLAEKLFSDTARVEARVTFIAEAVSPDEANAFRPNTDFHVRDTFFGTLLSAESTPAVIYYENPNGVLSSYEDASRFDLRGSLTVRAVFGENGCLLNGNTFIAAGSVFTLRANSVSVDITVLSVEPVTD
jgi:hypothetical protein